jgi:hypothetical protein
MNTLVCLQASSPQNVLWACGVLKAYIEPSVDISLVYAQNLDVLALPRCSQKPLFPKTFGCPGKASRRLSLSQPSVRLSAAYGGWVAPVRTVILTIAAFQRGLLASFSLYYHDHTFGTICDAVLSVLTMTHPPDYASPLGVV